MAQLNVLNNNLRVELDLIKSKYERKIQILTLNNNELNARVKNLINTLIGLKDYALSIERNMNDVSMMRQQGNNCSMFVKNNCSSFLNEHPVKKRIPINTINTFLIIIILLKIIISYKKDLDN